jgi:hypothetical protein
LVKKFIKYVHCLIKVLDQRRSHGYSQLAGHQKNSFAHCAYAQKKILRCASLSELATATGQSAETDINTSMSEQYLLPMARNTLTGQTVKTQDLTGSRFTPSQRALAEDMAQQLGDRMTARTGEPWQGFLQLYTPTTRR